MSKPVIGVFSEPPASTGSLAVSLPQIFPEHDIVRYSSRDLERYGLGANVETFIIPGITGERSLYTDHISPETAAFINRRVQNGLNLVLICAGAYFGAQGCAYKLGRNVIKPAWQAGFHDAHTTGPIRRYARRPEEGNRYSDLCVVRVRYKGADDKDGLAHLCYGNGPHFHINEDDPEISVYASFAELPGQPPAVFFSEKRQRSCDSNVGAPGNRISGNQSGERANRTGRRENEKTL